MLGIANECVVIEVDIFCKQALVYEEAIRERRTKEKLASETAGRNEFLEEVLRKLGQTDD